jgi:hypothetical protein
VFDTETSLWDAVLEVCASARAIPVWKGFKLQVVFDDLAQEVADFVVGRGVVVGRGHSLILEEGRCVQHSAP